MSQDRQKRVQRILKVQEQLHQAEAWRLAEMQQHLNALEQDQHDLISSLNAQDALQGLFMDATVRRLKSLADQARTAEVLKEEQAQRVLEVGAQLGAAERLFDKVTKDVERAQEERQLTEATERVAAQAPGTLLSMK